MKTELLIAELASRAAPVRPLPSPAIRALGWWALALVCAALGIVVYGARSDVAELMTERAFLWDAALATITIAVASVASLVLAVPAAERTPALRIVGLGLLALWAGTLIVAVVDAGHGLAGVSDWYICFVRVISIGLIPGLVLRGMLRRAAPLRLDWTSGLATVAALAAGALAIQFVCPVDDAGHAFVGHFGPVVALGAMAAVMAKRVLRHPKG